MVSFTELRLSSFFKTYFNSFTEFIDINIVVHKIPHIYMWYFNIQYKIYIKIFGSHRILDTIISQMKHNFILMNVFPY